MPANRCAHAPDCVPCPYRGLPVREQLTRKRETVRRALARLAGAVPEVEPCVGSRDLFGYRAVTKLVVRDGHDGRLRAGVYVPGTHRFAEASSCEVQPPPVNRMVGRFLELAGRAGIPAYDERRRTGELRYVVARWAPGTRTLLLILVTRSRNVRGLREVVRKLVRGSPPLGGVVQNVNPSPGNVILGREWATLRPPAGLVDRFGTLRLHWSPGSFAQANPWIARRIAETVVDWTAPEPDHRVADLFCGVGPLSLSLAPHVRQVTGIEEAPGAVRDARSNARRNGIGNATFVERLVDGTFPDATGAVDRIVLNPPRRGAPAAALAAIASTRARRVIYVSCNPETLGRDVGRLAGSGFRLTAVRPFDMMPQTPHVEVVARLER